jgi:1,4-alpha-glucan branching enzyme
MSAKSKTKRTGQTGETHCVRLELLRPDACEVCAAGSFNDWHPGVTPMIRLSDGKWARQLTLPPGRYEYRFVVDGQWIDDLAAKEFVPNPFGGVNAVLVVSGTSNTGPAANSTGSPLVALRQARKAKASTKGVECRA